MHTLSKDGDDTWCVMRAEQAEGQYTAYVVMFKGLSFGSAVQMVNCLNGGQLIDPQLAKVLERCTS